MWFVVVVVFFFFVCVCVCVCVCAFVFCLVSVLVSCSFTCYTMLVILILLRLATYILNSHCRAYTCMYYIIYIYLAIVTCMLNGMEIKYLTNKQTKQNKKSKNVYKYVQKKLTPSFHCP